MYSVIYFNDIFLFLIICKFYAKNYKMLTFSLFIKFYKRIKFADSMLLINFYKEIYVKFDDITLNQFNLFSFIKHFLYNTLLN